MFLRRVPVVWFCLITMVETSISRFGMKSLTADGMEYVSRSVSLPGTQRPAFAQTEHRLRATSDPHEDRLAVFLRLAHIDKEKILGLGPEKIKLAAMISLRQSMLALPRTINLSLTVIYDMDSLGDERVAETQGIVESVFSGLEMLNAVNHVVPAVSGNRATNLLQYQLSIELPNDPILYFVEEDYLHTESALRELVQIVQFNSTVFATGFDHPDRYWKGSVHGKPRGQSINKNGDRNDGLSYIIGNDEKLDRHWRTAESTTMTFAVRLSTFLSTYTIFEAYAPLDTEIWPLVIDDLGFWLFTPLPCLVTHMHYQSCFYLDWEGLTRANLELAEKFIK